MFDRRKPLNDLFIGLRDSVASDVARASTVPGFRTVMGVEIGILFTSASSNYQDSAEHPNRLARHFWRTIQRSDGGPTNLPRLRWAPLLSCSAVLKYSSEVLVKLCHGQSNNNHRDS